MTELTIKIAYPDARRLWALKKLQGRQDRSDSAIATEILEQELNRLFPDIPLYGKNGELLTRHNYKGGTEWKV